VHSCGATQLQRHRCPTASPAYLPGIAIQPVLAAPTHRRWAFPQLAALSLFYLHRTPRMCANPALYRACGLTGTTCAAAHTASVLSCLALLGAAIHRQELAARLAWVAPRTRRQLQAQQAAQPLAFWLNFALPSVCALLTYNYPWLY